MLDRLLARAARKRKVLINRATCGYWNENGLDRSFQSRLGAVGASSQHRAVTEGSGDIPPSALRLKAVALAAYRQNMPRRLRILFQLLA
jgi:hypothetical protein